MHFRESFSRALVAAAWLLASSGAYADVLPGSVMPEQVAKTLRPKASLVPSGVAPQQDVKEQQAPTNVSPEAQKIKFKLNGVVITGNHVIPTEKLAPFYKDKLNQTITVADLFKIVQNITNYYRNNGYIISRAILPPQHVKNGVVKIQIIEGYLSQVDVSGHPRGTK